MGTHLKHLILLILLILLPLLALASWQMDFDELWASAGDAGFSPLNLNPVAWWRGDGDATDSAGSFDGSWTGTDAYTNGINNQAFSFSQYNFVSGGNSADLVANEMTITAWIRPTNPVAGSLNENYIVSKVSGFATGSYLLRLDAAGKLNALAATSSGNKAVTSAAIVQANVWTHCVFVLKSGASTLYINGQADGINSDTFASVSITDDALNIGSRSNMGGVYFFSGEIDDVLFFDKALTAYEIGQIYEWRNRP